MTLRWGIVATGGIAHSFTADLRHAGLEIGAVSSRSLERAQQFAAEFGIPRAYGDFTELAADPDIDIVYIATPHPQHAAPALAAIANGKHVLIEKAFTSHSSDAHAIRDAAASAGVLAMEAMWARYLPHTAKLREIVASGVLGEIKGVMADHSRWLPTDPEHRLNAIELGGGSLLDLGIYPISLVWDVLGRPDTVQASGVFGPTGADVVVATIFGYDSGAIATTYSTQVVGGPVQATVMGTEASVFIDDPYGREATLRVVSKNGDELETFTNKGLFEGNGLFFEALAAEEYIAQGLTSSPVEPIDESVAIMEVMDEIRRQIGLVYPTDPQA